MVHYKCLFIIKLLLLLSLFIIIIIPIRHNFRPRTLPTLGLGLGLELELELGLVMVMVRIRIRIRLGLGLGLGLGLRCVGYSKVIPHHYYYPIHIPRPWQNNCLVLVTRPTLPQNALNCRLSTFLRALARNWNHGDSWNDIVKSWWRCFPNGDMWCRLGVHGFHLGYRKLITRICPNVWNDPFHS